MYTNKYNLFLVVLLTFLMVVEKLGTTNAYRVFDVNGVDTLLALENETITIVCKTEMPMAYCGFIHPSGKRFSFSGPSLSAGVCNVKTKATRSDSGEWNCHIGKRTIGVEIKQKINVRVVKKVAAIRPNITAIHGKDITIECVTAHRMTPIKYCRFEPPNGIPFSIDSVVKPSKPILGRFFYPQNKSLDRGDCAVTIRKVKYTDVGAWTCGAGLDDGKEHTDVIRLDVEGLYAMSTASTTGITFGIIGIIAFLAVLGVIAWKKRRMLGTAERAPEPVEDIEIQELPRPESPGSQRSPAVGRNIPSVTVQSPSEPGTSPMLR